MWLDVTSIPPPADRTMAQAVPAVLHSAGLPVTSIEVHES
jgi:hypothetical protein